MIEQLIAIAALHKQEKSPQLMQFMSEIHQKCPHMEDIIFVCIGSDRSTGDSFGPIVGSLLQALGFPHVIGTLEEPLDAYAVESQANALINEQKLIVAIDACLGQDKMVGQLLLKYGPIQPGAATGRRLPLIGHYSIAGVVNQLGPKAYWKLQNTSLQLVLQMASSLRLAVCETWQLNT